MAFTINPGCAMPPTFEEYAQRVLLKVGYWPTAHACHRMWQRSIQPESVVEFLFNGNRVSAPGFVAHNGRQYRRLWGPGPNGRRLYISLATDDPRVVVSVGWRD